MHKPPIALQCPNPECLAANSDGRPFCAKCGTFVPQRYLLAAGESIALKPGEMLAGRYYYHGDGIFLDAQPGLLPQLPDEVPEFIEPYLRLFPERVRVPQAYGFASDKGMTVWFLEKAPIVADAEGVRWRPSLQESWAGATPLRQLHWLWQMARLWTPMRATGVASSLLDDRLLRVEGGLLRLLRLEFDRTPPTLAQLGEFWQLWVPGARTEIAEFLDRLCQNLRSGDIGSPEALVTALDRALTLYGRTQSYKIQIATQTDRGPSRVRNEDACYPEPGSRRTYSNNALGIVCDGVGGHEGGDVASKTAIEVIERGLSQYQFSGEMLAQGSLVPAIEAAILESNRAISDRNNSEQRQGRQRMGTTLVMSLIHGHETYIAHVGDSRAYLIGSDNCYQITLDDDVASRDVRLGYALYRDALQNYSAGSLVQALGMGPSNTLHPTVERFILDGDCVFLLCSDGLSDRDRVEQYWRSDILPVLEDKIDPAASVRKLTEIANTHNGHDNVTIALVLVRVQPQEGVEVAPTALVEQLDNLPDSGETTEADTVLQFSPDEDETVSLAPQRSDPSGRFPMLLAGIIFAIAAVLTAILAYWFARTREETPSPQPVAVTIPETATNETLTVGAIGRTTADMDLYGEPGSADILAPLLANSTLMVLNNYEVGGDLWVEVQICQRPPAEGETATPEVPLDTAWKGRWRWTSSPG